MSSMKKEVDKFSFTFYIVLRTLFNKIYFNIKYEHEIL